MNGAEREASFCHHIPGYRAVNAARNQQKRPARGAGRHTACAFDLPAVDICVSVSYFNIHNYIGVVNVNGKVGESLEQESARLIALM